MMKRLSFILIFALLLSLPICVAGAANKSWDGYSSVPFSGMGTQTSPYIISSPEELKYLSDGVNAGNSFKGKYFSQTADIDLGNAEWKPIGKIGRPFAGIYTGNGHKITGLCITEANESVGLFGCINSIQGSYSGVQDLKVYGSITLKDRTDISYVGGVIGRTDTANITATGAVSVSNVESFVEIKITGCSELRSGGIVGQANEAAIVLCTFSGSIEHTASTSVRSGGITGQTVHSSMSYCVNNGNLNLSASGSATVFSGGICGICSHSDSGKTTFSYCVNNGNVTASADQGSSYGAGILGDAYSSGSKADMLIENCLNTGVITATGNGSKLAYAGGIDGYCNKTGFKVSGCVNTQKSITGKSGGGTRAGGIFGVHNNSNDTSGITVENCTTVGSLYGYNKNLTDANTPNVSVAAAEKAGEKILLANAEKNGTAAPDTDPVETTAKPVETTAKPVETTVKPVETAVKPVDTTVEPVETAGKPEETSATPPEETSGPDEPTAEPTETAAGAAETAAGTDGSDAGEKKTGCGSLFSLSAILALLPAAALTARRKRE